MVMVLGVERQHRDGVLRKVGDRTSSLERHGKVCVSLSTFFFHQADGYVGEYYCDACMYTCP